MVDVKAIIDVKLLEGEWDPELIAITYGVLQAFKIESVQTHPDEPEKATFTISTNFDDDESTAETAEYCLSEDLADAELPVETTLVWGEPRSN